MATFEKRGNFWRAKVRRRGCPDQTRSFNTKALAEKWARVVEFEFDHAGFVDRSVTERTALSEILIRYAREVTPGKRGAQSEALRVTAMAKRRFASIQMSALTSSHLASFRDERLRQVSSGTVCREFSVARRRGTAATGGCRAGRRCARACLAYARRHDVLAGTAWQPPSRRSARICTLMSATRRCRSGSCNERSRQVESACSPSSSCSIKLAARHIVARGFHSTPAGCSLSAMPSAVETGGTGNQPAAAASLAAPAPP